MYKLTNTKVELQASSFNSEHDRRRLRMVQGIFSRLKLIPTSHWDFSSFPLLPEFGGRR